MYHQKADEIEKIISYYNQRKLDIDITKKNRDELIAWLSDNKTSQGQANDFTFRGSNFKISVKNDFFDSDKYVTLIIGDEEFYSAPISDVILLKEIIKGIIS